MPIYEYVCESCGYEFEELQGMSEPPVEVCPKCGAKQVRRKMSVSGFHLKGTGWYVTDFKDSGRRSSSTSKSSGTSAEGSSS